MPCNDIITCYNDESPIVTCFRIENTINFEDKNALILFDFKTKCFKFDNRVFCKLDMNYLISKKSLHVTKVLMQDKYSGDPNSGLLRYSNGLK